MISAAKSPRSNSMAKPTSLPPQAIENAAEQAQDVLADLPPEFTPPERPDHPEFPDTSVALPDHALPLPEQAIGVPDWLFA
jgi:hypothetical protein